MKYPLIFFLLILGNSNLNAQDVSSPIEYFNSYQFKEAIDTLDKKLDKTAPDYFILAKSYKKLGQVDEALASIDSALKFKNDDVTYLNFLGELQLKGKYKLEAYTTYLTLCQLQPTNAYYYKKIGEALNSNAFPSIRKQQLLFANDGVLPENNEQEESVMKKFYALELPAYAAAAYQKAIELNPQDIESKIILTERYLKMNNLGGADILNKSSLAMHPENEKLIMQAIKIAARLRDYQDVVSKCDLYTNIAGQNLVVQKMKGIAQFHLEEYEQCIELLKEVVEVDKNSEVLHYYIGLAYQEVGNIKEAAKYFESAIDLGITENIGNYYTRLAIVEEELGNYKKSIQLFKAAYSETNDKILLYHLARNYDTFYKDKSTALKYYNLYLEENDSSNLEYLDYSKARINELKVVKHFNLDSL